MVWTTLIEDHPGIIPVKFGQNSISSSEEMLFKEIVDGRTDWHTDDKCRTLKDHKSSLSTSCSGELKMISQAKVH